MNYRVSYPGQVTHVASSPATFCPTRARKTNTQWRGGKKALSDSVTVVSSRAGVLLLSLVGAPGIYDSLDKLALLEQLVGESTTHSRFLSSTQQKDELVQPYVTDEDAFSWVFLLSVGLDVSGSRRHGQNHGRANLHLNVKEVVPDVSEIHILWGKKKTSVLALAYWMKRSVGTRLDFWDWYLRCLWCAMMTLAVSLPEVWYPSLGTLQTQIRSGLFQRYQHK